MLYYIILYHNICIIQCNAARDPGSSLHLRNAGPPECLRVSLPIRRAAGRVSKAALHVRN